jgi:pimeloyl-ACP methyl ester carboxylesterase
MRRIGGDGVDLAYLDEGAGPAVLLLHGFPDSHRLWRNQIPALTAAGMRTIAPDLRGFGESDKPEAVAEYGVARSVADMVALLDGLDIERAHVVGHDWGAAVAWAMAAFVSDRVERLVVLSVAHPSVFRSPSTDQREKAWYKLLFQFEDVAEELLQRDDWALLREWLRGNGDMEQYLSDLSRPGALTAALNWYRATSHPRRELEPPRAFPPISAPAMGVWSSGDDYLVESMPASAEHVAGPFRYERIERASHWLQLDQPELVNRLLVEFLA